MDSSLSCLMARRILANEYKSLMEQSLEGFIINLVDEDNLFDWDIGMFGPPETIYEGAYLRALLRFPYDYPFSPPIMRFTDNVWHPNVYPNGLVCISILHPVTTRVTRTGELPSERWNPTQTVRTILLSVVSMLNAPNDMSPANAEAAAMYRFWRDPDIQNTIYPNRVRQLAAQSNARARLMGIVVPTTLEDYCRKTPQCETDQNDNKSLDTFQKKNDDDDDNNNDDEGSSSNTSEN